MYRSYIYISFELCMLLLYSYLIVIFYLMLHIFKRIQSLKLLEMDIKEYEPSILPRTCIPYFMTRVFYDNSIVICLNKILKTIINEETFLQDYCTTYTVICLSHVHIFSHIIVCDPSRKYQRSFGSIYRGRTALYVLQQSHHLRLSDNECAALAGKTVVIRPDQ